MATIHALINFPQLGLRGKGMVRKFQCVCDHWYVCIGACTCRCTCKCNNVHSWVDLCVSSSAHSCGCVVHSGDAMAAF